MVLELHFSTNQSPLCRHIVFSSPVWPMKTSNLSTRLPNTARPWVAWRAVGLIGQLLPSGHINLLGTSTSSLRPLIRHFAST